MNKYGLLLINFQNDYLPGGMDPIEGAEQACQIAGAILQCFRDHNRPFMHIQRVNRYQPKEPFQAGTLGIRIHDRVPHFENEPIGFDFTDLPKDALIAPLSLFQNRYNLRSGLICFLGEGSDLFEIIQNLKKTELQPILIKNALAIRNDNTVPHQLANLPSMSIDEIFQTMSN
ncbi:MAG TPA: hypothetical protein VN226_08255 [Anaerolineales bacterium]|nr:hypothetical protein [Anaerolineales bacterium]